MSIALSLNMLCYILLMTSSYQRCLPLKILKLKVGCLLGFTNISQCIHLILLGCIFQKEFSWFMVVFQTHAQAHKYTHTRTQAQTHSNKQKQTHKNVQAHNQIHTKKHTYSGPFLFFSVILIYFEAHRQ